MKKRKKKNAITLLALVITIVIMLLLAGVAIQMIMGENGLIAKSVQAQKEQAKAELYDTAKLSYMSLNAKALENGQSSPQTELALSTTEFTNKYNVVGDDITDKKGTVIESKLKLINELNELRVISEEPEISMKGEYIERPWPKKVSGVTISEEDKDKMILKLIVKNDTAVKFDSLVPQRMKADYGDGEITDRYNYIEKAYNKGEYVLKFRDVGIFRVGGEFNNNDYEIEILQWGDIRGYNNIEIYSVTKIYEPEPDNIVIWYCGGKFTEIPEWLFSKKVTESYHMSKFIDCKNITSIPEGLFKNNVNAKYFYDTFKGCTGITSIPENLFKYNTKVKVMSAMFKDCTGITSIPEGLFKNNVNVTNFLSVFSGCTGLTSIPEGLFKNNVNAKEFVSVFSHCTGITNIPEGLFESNVNATNFERAFYGCTGLTSIPEGLFKNNVNVTNFALAFSSCTGITNIPEELFKYNKIIENIWESFEGCSNITYIPDNIIEVVKKVKEKHGDIREVFKGCTSASNYNSLPAYMK